MADFFSVMALPMLACLILVGIHAYLGLHVVERGVIFVDLALAQIAVLGASISILFGYDLDHPYCYWLSLGFTIAGAALFSISRLRHQRIPQEAVIGIVYAVSAAVLVLILSRSGEGDEHIRQSLAGNILLVSKQTVVEIFVIYALVGFFHFLFRKQFFLISKDPEEAYQKGVRVRLWDFIFYVLFGVVVTSSVRIAGVLLVFSFLIVPSVCAMLFSKRLGVRLVLAWIFGLLASLIGMTLSYSLDFPTGASIVAAFGALLVVLSFGSAIIKRSG